MDVAQDADRDATLGDLNGSMLPIPWLKQPVKKAGWREPHEATEVHHAAGRRGCGLAARGACAAAEQGLAHRHAGYYSAALNAANVDAFRQGLRRLGYAEGQNLVIDYRSADGRIERFTELAAEMIRLKIDLIVTRGTPSALAAKNATATIPIVMAASGEPVGTGLVASLARPGGNITGLSAFVTDLVAKRIELLREVVPRIARIALLDNMSNVASACWEELKTAVRSLGIEPQLLDVRSARRPEARVRCGEHSAR